MLSAHRMLRDHVHLWITFVFVNTCVSRTKCKTFGDRAFAVAGPIEYGINFHLTLEQVLLWTLLRTDLKLIFIN